MKPWLDILAWHPGSDTLGHCRRPTPASMPDFVGVGVVVTERIEQEHLADRHERVAVGVLLAAMAGLAVRGDDDRLECLGR